MPRNLYNLNVVPIAGDLTETSACMLPKKSVSGWALFGVLGVAYGELG